MADLAAKIAHANAEVISIIQKGDLILEDIAPAKEVIPFLRDNAYSFLHAGPPIAIADMCESMKGSVIGAFFASTPQLLRSQRHDANGGLGQE